MLGSMSVVKCGSEPRWQWSAYIVIMGCNLIFIHAQLESFAPKSIMNVMNFL